MWVTSQKIAIRTVMWTSREIRVLHLAIINRAELHYVEFEYGHFKYMNLRKPALSCVLTLLLSACTGGADDVIPKIIIDNTDAIAGGNNTSDTANEGTDNTVAEENVTEGMQNDATQVSYRTPAGVEECSTEDILHRVEFDMRDYYIYYDQVPSVNLSDYRTPESLIRALRVAPDVFSSVADTANQNALSDDGQTLGFGFWFLPDKDGVVRFREILSGSPADQAGILRGDQVILFNGRPVNDVSDDEIEIEMQPFNSPVVMQIQTGDDEPREVLVRYEEYQWRTAGPGNRFINRSDDSLPVVGYLPIRRFIETTEAEINASLDALEAEGGFDELIVDLRYNPGGFIKGYRHIASIIGGAAVDNKVYRIEQWNDKYSANNSSDFFDSVEKPLNLPRVFVLVTEFSTSAADAFINALRPYISVVVVGADVVPGTAFTSRREEYCGKTINAMSSISTNADGLSVADGIQSDCPVVDNWVGEASSAQDSLVSGALTYITEGGCPIFVAPEQNSLSAASQGPSYRALEQALSVK